MILQKTRELTLIFNRHVEVLAHWLGVTLSQAAIKAIVANPPIEQSGNTVRIGHLGETQRHSNISISYELVVPADTKLLSKTGSGHQEISGVAGPADVTSGSGSLRLADIAQIRRWTDKPVSFAEIDRLPLDISRLDDGKRRETDGAPRRRILAGVQRWMSLALSLVGF